ncbi:MAG: carboxypeptidase-like regulatory domain-containing protein, partial [Holophagales bacterium]|nr:carboxypeptidase-like regulatory domain-containing protein [Holophagales bacterium]
MTRPALLRPHLLALFGALLLAAPLPADAASRPVSVAGRVLAEDGSAVTTGMAELRPLHAGELSLPSATAAGEGGRFAIDAPSPGMWRLTVRAEGHVPGTYTLEPLLEPTVLSPARLPADLGKEVAVMDAAGRPIAGAEVRARSLDLGAWPPSEPGPLGGRWLPAARSGHTGNDGRLRLPRGAHERLAITAWAPDHTLARAPEGDSGRVVLERAAGLVFRLHDSFGQPVPGARLRIRPGDWQLGPSDAQGRLPGLAVVGDLRAYWILPDGRRQRVHPGLGAPGERTPEKTPGTEPGGAPDERTPEKMPEKTPGTVPGGETPGTERTGTTGTEPKTPGTDSVAESSGENTPGTEPG